MPFDLDKLRQDYDARLSAAKASEVAQGETYLRSQGIPERDIQRTKGQLQSTLPGSMLDIAGAALPWLVSRVVPQGRTFTRAAGTFLGNIGARGALEATLGTTPGESRDTAFVRGAQKGALPGAAQALTGGILGPSKTTLKASRAAKAASQEFSPELGKVLSSERPASIFSGGTVKKMQEEAGKKLDAMEARIGQAVQGQTFSLIDPKTRVATQAGTGFAKGTPATFEEVRDRIKTLREEADLNRLLGQLTRAGRTKMKQARLIERDLLGQLRAVGTQGPAIVQDYLSAIQQHARDMEALKWLRAIQSGNALAGGVNPLTRPGLAQAQKTLGPSVPPSAAVHGGVGAIEGALGRPGAAAWQLGRVADYLRRSGPLQPAAQLPSRIPAPAVGSGMSILQTLAPYLIGNQESS